MKHIELDNQDEQVKQFVLSLQSDFEESILEADGKPIVRVIPIVNRDNERLKQAILDRRDESRALNAEWEDVDRDVWDRG